MTEQAATSGRVLVGCAGWAIPRDVAPAFPPEGSHLARYAAVFNAVEINSSFYRPHRPASYARWADSVPEDFLFSVKLPRSITHDAGLRDIDAPLDRFAVEAGALGGKLGCILVQLPPKLDFELTVAADFFDRLRARFDCMLALEARHPGWFGEPATVLLRGQGVTRVIADPPKGQDGPHVPTTAAIYARLHGAPRIYYSAYEPGYLAQLADDARVHAAQGRTVWTMFDNTASGAAVPDALAVLGRHEKRGAPAGIAPVGVSPDDDQ
jgi:uncharacterized protein YecE (DUF72 family)